MRRHSVDANRRNATTTSADAQTSAKSLVPSSKTKSNGSTSGTRLRGNVKSRVYPPPSQAFGFQAFHAFDVDLDKVARTPKPKSPNQTQRNKRRGIKVSNALYDGPPGLSTIKKDARKRAATKRRNLPSPNFAVVLATSLSQRRRRRVKQTGFRAFLRGRRFS